MLISKKKLQILSTLICVFCVLLLPVDVFALEAQSTGINPTNKTTSTEANRLKEKQQTITPQSAKTTQTSCAALNKITSQIQSQLTERKSKIDSKKISIYLKSGTEQQKRTDELISKRDEWDAKRQSNFDKLRSYAKTDGQKQAVEDYIDTLTEAINVRRSANDIAITTFRSDLENLKKTASQSAEVNVSATTANINQAIASAKSACESGQSLESVKQTLKTSIEAARQQSKATRESFTKGEQLKSIITKRNDAFKANDAVFKESTKVARETLKSAFEGQ